MFRRFARLALMLTALAAMIIAAGLPAGADDRLRSEPPPSEPAEAAPARLVLRPVCTAGRLHRFAVDHIAGPPTQFKASLLGDPGGVELHVAAGATQYFWIAAAQPGTTEITWPGGTASASQADQPCDPGAEVPIAPVSEDPQPSPPWSDDPPAARSAPRAGAPGTAGTAPPADTGSQQPPSTNAPPSSNRAPATDQQPQPTARGTSFACPEGWIAVDSDRDHGVDDADNCEAVVGAPASGQRSPMSWPAVTLVVTLALLMLAIGLGATTRRGP